MKRECLAGKRSGRCRFRIRSDKLQHVVESPPGKCESHADYKDVNPADWHAAAAPGVAGLVYEHCGSGELAQSYTSACLARCNMRNGKIEPVRLGLDAC